MSEIFSVGVDVGTSTSQTVFSALSVENTASYFAVPRVRITGKRLVFAGPVRFTPYLSDNLVDGESLRLMVTEDFRLAGFGLRDMDTGAVIVTGEAARKENAAVVIENLSKLAGDFVVAAAGPDLEAVLAGKGSGAQAYAIKNKCRVVNVDIGGGTSNFSLFDEEDVVATSCLDIGGRLIRLEKNGIVSYIAPAAFAVSESLKIPLRVGDFVSLEELMRITECMAELILRELGLKPSGKLTESIRTANSSLLPSDFAAETVCFSGGVAESIYNKPALDETSLFKYGDIGPLLGRAIISSFEGLKNKIIGGSETIRATVVGCGNYATTISGSTISIAKDVLPLKNIPVLRLGESEADLKLLHNSDALTEKIRSFQNLNDQKIFALAFKGAKNISFGELENLTLILTESFDKTLPENLPVLIILESDIGKALGQALGRSMNVAKKIICIDGVEVSKGDYIDIGKPMMDGLVVPVVVKTLVF